jgi:hypothetical protein
MMRTILLLKNLQKKVNMNNIKEIEKEIYLFKKDKNSQQGIEINTKLKKIIKNIGQILNLYIIIFILFSKI